MYRQKYVLRNTLQQTLLSVFVNGPFNMNYLSCYELS